MSLLRQDNTLFVNVIEGKGMRNGEVKDAYCTIRFDDPKDLVRTQTQYGTPTPVWGEEYHFEVYPNFQELCLVVFDHPDSSKADGRPVGKVCVSKQALRADPQECEQWFPMTRVEDYHTPGKVQVQVLKRKSKNGVDIDVGILELRALDGAQLYDTCSTYFEVALFRRNQRVSNKLRTATAKHIPQSYINETFEFHVPDDTGIEVKILYYKYHRWRPNGMLGRCVVPLSQIPLKVPLTAFYDLEPKSSPENNELGLLKFKYKYTEEFILPLQEYEELLDLLLDEQLAVIIALGKLATDREDVARTLLRIFDGKTVTPKYVRLMYMLDIKHTVAANDVNLLFRGNSIGTKTVEMYMKLVGQQYLTAVLKPLIKGIYDCPQSCEVDPTKLAPGEDLAANQEQLRKHLSHCFEVIFASKDRIPPRFRELFHEMRKTVAAHFSEARVPMHAVSGFLFLRFFCPAILSPKIFKVHDDHPNKTAKRALVLVAKHIQRLATLTEGSVGKEDLLRESEEVLESQRQGMYRFIDALSSEPEELPPRIGLNLDLEKELACIHRHLNRTRDKLEKYHASHEGLNIEKLFPVLDKLNLTRDERLSEMQAMQKSADEDSRPRLRSMYTSLPTTTPTGPNSSESRSRSASASLLQLDKIDVAEVEGATAN
ncbi:hypothetical protein CAOG_04381 [Capsaspora owczarzaki ATCC 30864]|uniref:Ras GTPase-activating protein 3 n=1 Tax=Capsaspora owczarzaki (strain ATCC 30864) TaxID=595528 RepID=A0A0D2VRU1_CAPO3|nr:hypothetical protein CAOG_04381 [Capsaspora owczarzaki ATCC 30864]KJE93622.1 hypothetical protein CAOG_004381 [Capsaspora owczarzaki ATCC 30864]|eukprot:XP_004348209.1 hypothetical protein CAOG_04381 [Capsaspora owczarzaki ATCC 30864]